MAAQFCGERISDSRVLFENLADLSGRILRLCCSTCGCGCTASAGCACVGASGCGCGGAFCCWYAASSLIDCAREFLRRRVGFDLLLPYAGQVVRSSPGLERVMLFNGFALAAVPTIPTLCRLGFRRDLRNFAGLARLD